MPDLTSQDMAAKLLADRFEHVGPPIAAVTDPVADTPMVVTLDQLESYDLNPRVTRNPLYDEIKASIRARGLDAPPPITRRPGATHYIIRNGGNTRLSILRELWSETKNEQFYRLKCLFRPWSARGEIEALTGHLCENELHGELTFVEKALGVEKARELYEQETGGALSQRELARRLTTDGYPISQSQISRMQETVTYLLPAIPSILYAGLGRGLAERLTGLRRSAARAWEQHAHSGKPGTEFGALFNDVLASFDHEPSAFSIERVRDELIGQVAQVLATDYDTLALQIVDAEMRQRVLTPESPPISELGWPKDEPAIRVRSSESTSSHGSRDTQPPPSLQASTDNATATSEIPPAPLTSNVRRDDVTESATGLEDRLKAHIVSPAETTDRLQSIERTIADATGDQVQSFQENVVRAIPVQAGGLHPISDVWYIAPAIDAPDRLRTHIAQLAREIAQEADLARRIEPAPDGVGYFCAITPSESKESSTSFIARATWGLLNALSSCYQTRRKAGDGIRLVDDLAPLLQGTLPSQRLGPANSRLSDTAIVKLFRLIRLARRLVELESDV